MATLCPPLLTCEPVLAEAARILRRHGCDTDPLLASIERSVLNIAFSVESELAPLRQLMRRYRDQPRSLADAASSASPNSTTSPVSGPSTPIFFRVYRRLGRLVIPILTPDEKGG